MKTHRITLLAMLIAISILFGYLEAILPLLIAIPGIKLGFANIPIMFAVYKMKPLDVFLISIVRVVILSLTFRNMLAFLFSLSGAIFSISIMLLFKQSKFFSVTGVSIAGGVAHNMGQIIMAALILQIPGLLYYLPLLIIAGVIAGIIIGLISGLLIERINLSIK